MHDRKYLLALPLVAAVFLIAGIWVGAYFNKGSRENIAREKLYKVFSLIEDSYVDEVSFDSLVEMTIP